MASREAENWPGHQVGESVDLDGAGGGQSQQDHWSQLGCIWRGPGHSGNLKLEGSPGDRLKGQGAQVAWYQPQLRVGPGPQDAPCHSLASAESLATACLPAPFG